MVTKEPFKDDAKDPAGSVHTITADKDRHHPLGGILKFAEYSVDAGGLSGSGWTTKIGIAGTCAMECRTHGSGDLAEFSVAIMDGFRGIF